MIEKYFGGIIDQVYSKIGRDEKNIVMACYNSDFSAAGLEQIERYSKEKDNVFFKYHELKYDRVIGAYEPFLDVVCEVYRNYVNGDFAQFLEECDVYYLHRKTLLSYYETGHAKREEQVLLHEIAYEQENMTIAVVNILKKLAEIHPIMLVICRFQLANHTMMEIIRYLHEKPCKNIGIALSCTETKPREALRANWDEMLERMQDNSSLFHLGNSLSSLDSVPEMLDETVEAVSDRRFKDMNAFVQQLSNIIELMDYEQAMHYCTIIEKRVKFEDVKIQEDIKFNFFLLYIHVAIFSKDLSKGLELVEELSGIRISEKTNELRYYYPYYAGVCSMYQGKLEEAISCAKVARNVAKAMGDEFLLFKAELLGAEALMSGWYNIFFCVKEFNIEESLIERMMKYNFKNHLAHVYIYAFDNRPELVAMAYRSEAALVYFSKGIAIAKEIGNSQLVYKAYEKNIMISSTNGMSEIALLYTMRSYQYMVSRNIGTVGRLFTSLGYNLASLGLGDEADQYYNRAIEEFYANRNPEYIAEVQYNKSMNDIMRGDYIGARHQLQMVMKAVERLHLNSLRVCNLSKLYALLALTHILQKERFNCERYLADCQQFLNYAIEKSATSNEAVHDYANCDDDIFLCSFATALLYVEENNFDAAYEEYEKADRHLEKSMGNLLFVYDLFREKRIEFFEMMEKKELLEKEKATLKQHQEMARQIVKGIPMELLQEMGEGIEVGPCRISDRELELHIKQEGTARDLLNTKHQLDFISIWQKMLDTNHVGTSATVDAAIRSFINHFSIDRLLYVFYKDGIPRVMYNDTNLIISTSIITGLEHCLEKQPQGFAVSKISQSFREHLDVISYFGEDNVCSLAAIPYFTNGQLNSFVIAYVEMKDNWHSSIGRYMLDEDDLNIYSLLFREMRYSILRMEATQKVATAAITDLLTGLYNRAGMYEEIARRTNHFTAGSDGLAVMFIDLDNFKPYNDTYGHNVGDIVLNEMAAIFREAIDSHGFACRYGGDEFILIVQTSDKETIEHIAEDIYAKIAIADGFQRKIEAKLNQKVVLSDSSRIGCSIGITTEQVIRNEEEFEQMIRRADEQMYSVKTTNKGHYAFI